MSVKNKKTKRMKCWNSNPPTRLIPRSFRTLLCEGYVVIHMGKEMRVSEKKVYVSIWTYNTKGRVVNVPYPLGTIFS